jgi:hypothetical protein
MTPSGSWKRLMAAVVIFVLGFAGITLTGVALPSTAAAIPGLSDCKDAPTPEVPGRGVEAFFEPAPATPPPAADPFAPGATTSIHQQYGYAGLRWNTFDLGCAGSPEATVGSTVANWMFTLPKAVVAATGAMLGASFEPQFLRVFDPLVTTVSDALRRSIFDQWAGLVLAALGFFIVWRARRASLRGTAAAIGWALLVMVIATVLFRWPLAAGQAADATVTTTMGAVTSALDEHDPSGRTSTGTMAENNLHDALLYQVWLGGEFGDANSVTARRYGAKLFDAQALTWAQAATLAQDPAAGQRIIEAKKTQFQQIADQVKAEDPDAYEYLAGRRSDARIGFAALSLFAVACAVPFLLMAALLIVGALVITRFAVMLFPAIATLGLFPTMRSLVIGAGNTVAAAVINAMVFGLGSAVMVKAFGVVMAPGSGLPAWLVVALVLLLTIVMWVALRPFHRLTAMASPGRNSFADAAGALGTVGRGLGRVSGRLAGTAIGVAVGESTANARRDEHDKDKEKDDGEKAPRAEADRRTGEDGDGTAPGALAGGGRRPALPGGGRSEQDRGGAAPSGSPGASGPSASKRSSGTSGKGRRGFTSGRGGTGEPAGAPPGELVAAEVGVSRPRRGGAPGSPAAESGSTAAAESGSTASAAASPRAPVRQAAARGPAGRPVPRRSEAFDLDGPGALSGDAYAVYRPSDRDQPSDSSGEGRG